MSDHHITPLKTYLVIASCLFFLSGVTVWVSYIDLGSFNIVLAMFVATEFTEFILEATVVTLDATEATVVISPDIGPRVCM